jgi:hypothetical protein
MHHASSCRLAGMLGPKSDTVMVGLKKDARELFDSMDKNEDGTLDRAEYDSKIKPSMKIFMDKVMQATMQAMMAGGPNRGDL